MHKAILILLFFYLLAVAGRACLGVEITASELSARVLATSRAIENASFSVTYIDSIDGGPAQYTVVKIVYDSLGRIRMTEIDKGSYDTASEKKVSSRKGRSDKAFDGEKSVVLNTQTDLDESGNPIVSLAGVVHTAVVADAMDGAGMWRRSQRNALRNNPKHLLARLEVLAGLGQTVDLSPTQYQGEEAVVAHFQQGGVDVTAILDPQRSWALRDLIERDSAGTTTKHYHAEYMQSTEGFWLPSSGTTMILHQNKEPPVLKLPKVKGGKIELDFVPNRTPTLRKHSGVFKLASVVINDPKFDESVFTISLPTGTLVSDLRFKTAFRIGESKATDTELRKLAKLAREQPESFKAISRTRGYSLTWMILGSLVLTAVLIFAGVRAKRALIK